MNNSGHLGIAANILVERLPNVIPKRHVVFRFATDFAGMTPETSSRVDEPTMSFTVIGRFHSVAPKLFWLEFLLHLTGSRLLARHSERDHWQRRRCLL